MTPRMSISRTGLAFIMAYEGFRRHAARLHEDAWVIGYSHVETARADMSVSPLQAEALLIHDLRPIINELNERVLAPLTQSQFDALCSLTFNIGVRNLGLSGLLSAINEGRTLDAAAGFDVWRLARVGEENMVIDGLVRRRAAERALFLSPPNGPVAVPSAQVTVLADPDAVYGAPREAAVDLAADLNGERATLRASGPAHARPADRAALEAIARIRAVAPDLVTDPLVGGAIPQDVPDEPINVLDPIQAGSIDEGARGEATLTDEDAFTITVGAGESKTSESNGPHRDVHGGAIGTDEASGRGRNWFDLIADPDYAGERPADHHRGEAESDVAPSRRAGGADRSFAVLLGLVGAALVAGGVSELVGAVAGGEGRTEQAAWQFVIVTGALSLAASLYALVRGARSE